MYTHSFSFQDPSVGQLHYETQLIFKTPTSPWEANTTNARNRLQGARNHILYNDGTRLHLPNICPDTHSPITRSLNENILFLLSKGRKLINLPKWLFPDKAILWPTKLIQEWIPTVSQDTLTTDSFSPCYLLSIKKKKNCIHIHSSNLLSYTGKQ